MVDLNALIELVESSEPSATIAISCSDLAWLVDVALVAAEMEMEDCDELDPLDPVWDRTDAGRWAVVRPAAAEPRRCASSAVEFVGPVPLCTRHARDLVEEVALAEDARVLGPLREERSRLVREIDALNASRAASL